MNEDELKAIRERRSGLRDGPRNFHKVYLGAIVISNPNGITDADVRFYNTAPSDISALLDEIEQLTNWIIEADSVFNTDGHTSKNLDECVGLVRMCHEGRAALDKQQDLEAEIMRLRGIDGTRKGGE